jgi:antitoxin component YwqK of YwqJK toxin-antitoxin module
MRKIFVSKFNLILMVTLTLLLTRKCQSTNSCDTTVWSTDTTIRCIESHCPKDSVVTYHMKNGVSRKNFVNCGDSAVFVLFSLNGDTITHSISKAGKTIGLRRIFYPTKLPQRFTNFSSTGQKDGWEVFWYSNGKTKDSTLYSNDDIIKGTSFYLNGKPSLIEDSISGKELYSATSYTPKGKKNGAVINGTGTISVCDSIGSNCHTLTFKNGKRVFE